MRSRNRRWLLAWTLSSLFPYITLYEVATQPHDYASKNHSKEARGIFTPRMDYDQWTPLGRGDPLKNDPTYDYVPPVLDRVHYWIEPSSRKPDSITTGESQKTEILVLGVSSKKPSTGTSISADSRKDTYDPFLKFVEGPKFGLQTNYQRMSKPTYNYYHQPSFKTKNKIEGLVSSEDDRSIPYTFLMPPPVEPKESSLAIFPQTLTSPPVTEGPITTFSVTSPSGFTVQQSNLLYHSTTVGDQNQFRDQNYFGTAGASSSQVTWRSPLANFNPQQNDSVTYKENIIIDNVVPILRDTSQVMHKGQVSDDDLDIANTYVNIGKPEAQMHSPSDMKISSVSVEPPRAYKHSPILLQLVNPDMTISKPTPMTMQTIHTMQTMHPPPVVHTPVFSNSLHSLLQNELTTNTPKATPFRVPSSITSSPPVTTTTSLTTDPLFKHYKQPNEPLRGPMYLIIQGHSKVKTYGPSKQLHGISVQELNEIPTSDDQYVVKHLHGYKKESNEGRLRQGRSSMLQTLSHVVQTGLGAIDFSENEANRKKNDVQETEFVVSYDVSSQGDVTSERYYKGIVEAGDMARNIKNGIGKR
ncbi:hypothetical protein PPYR_06898 [Photinus pyralis]|uniref:Uncharacterized protein n=1 Tax=Photinus pyralis TaxID=7054 RepID=A0A5N4AP76_PHOPY|nr:uncharacterized protein LOC116169739 [Photinus pyralis]KAB0799018.1 hypothetical protein PPYR_06898 [Photinus pyralis]